MGDGDGQPLKNILYTVELDLPSDSFGEIINWNAFRHVPDMYKCRGTTVALYLPITSGAQMMNIYEFPHFDCFTSRDYEAIAGYLGPLMEKRTNVATATYQQRPIDSVGQPPRLDADWVSVTRFDTSDGALEEVARRIREYEKKGSFGDRLKGLRLARRSVDRPGASSDRPNTMVLAEWLSRPVPNTSLADLLGVAFPGKISHASEYVAFRACPWPNDPLLRRASLSPSFTYEHLSVPGE